MFNSGKMHANEMRVNWMSLVSGEEAAKTCAWCQVLGSVPKSSKKNTWETSWVKSIDTTVVYFTCILFLNVWGFLPKIVCRFGFFRFSNFSFMKLLK